MFRKKIEKTHDKISISLKNWYPESTWFTPFIVYSVVLISKFIMQVLNTVEIFHKEELLNLHERENRGLITFSNHNCLFDDPFLISCLGKVDIVSKRYIAADAQNFFSRKHTGFFFSQGRCVPIVRGAGMQQPGFDFLKKILSEGGWVHIFPEGTRNRKPEEGIQSNFTHGMAHLILSSKPLVLPFYHFGMEKVLPVGGRLPRIGNKIKVIFGKKVDLSDTGLKEIFGESCLEPSNNRDKIKKISDWSYKILKSLEDTEKNKV
jgi:monolysocardiolipin acyltransferase